MAPREEIAAREKLDLTARQEIGELEVTRTESFQLSYAKALDLATLLKNKDSGLLSKRGSAVSDLRTNTLFVQDTPTRLEEVRALIKKLDVPVRQVLIEARFVQAGETFQPHAGWALKLCRPGIDCCRRGVCWAGGQHGLRCRQYRTLPTAASTTAGGMTLSLFNAAATKVLTLELNAAELDGTTKNIASPRVVTGDKTPATIESGVQVPYQQGGGLGVAATVAFKDAVLGLTVTPQITPDDRVGMKMSVHNDTVGNIYSGVPSINTNKVDTQVLVDNGGTVVIGGVYTQDTSDSKNQIPLLGDIPIIGWLFKTDNLVKSKKELLVFITPKILKDNMDMK